MHGLTALHLTDPHARWPARRSRTTRTLLEAIAATPADLVLLTGDYMSDPGDERAALEWLCDVTHAARARLGVFGVFGNHDTSAFARTARRDPALAHVHWLDDAPVTVADADRGATIRVYGSSEPEGLLGHRVSVIGAAAADLELALVHVPSEAAACATLGIPLAFAGHTHGGQVRLNPKHAPHTSCDLKPDAATGVLRYRDTLVSVARGLGEAVVMLRANCPRQAPLIELRCGETIGGSDPSRFETFEQVLPW
ncbi:MAG: metallophosphoesterase [Planctomycetota bacterium]